MLGRVQRKNMTRVRVDFFYKGVEQKRNILSMLYHNQSEIFTDIVTALHSNPLTIVLRPFSHGTNAFSSIKGYLFIYMSQLPRTYISATISVLPGSPIYDDYLQ